MGPEARETDAALAGMERDPDPIARRTAAEARERIAGSRARSPLACRPNSYRDFECGTGGRGAARHFQRFDCSRKKS